MPGNLPLSDGLAWLSKNAVEGGAYTVTLSGDESVASGTLSYSGKTVSITLLGSSAERTVSGSLFTVGNGVTLKLGNNITLRGLSGNMSALVRVQSGGTLEMNPGSKISGNINSFLSSPYGGGVYVDGGTFTMNGGEISGNSASSSSSAFSSHGGGVYVDGGTFTMSGGEISGNSASHYGGGVYVSGGTFTMSGGKISGNTSSYGGGVVFGGTFTMSGGEISGNTASSYGGGVYVSSGTFTMSDGKISGNTASSYGGGVYVSGSTFTKQPGGVIYGSNASSSLQNTAPGDSYGHAVYVFISSNNSQKRNATAGEGVTLDSTQDGVAGGWE
jgi:hypothetical protein